jgi:hypothetical protein
MRYRETLLLNLLGVVDCSGFVTSDRMKKMGFIDLAL